MSGVGYGLPLGVCHCEVISWKAHPAPVGEKCDMAFSFYIQYFSVTYSTLAVFCWSVVAGVGYFLTARAFQYETYAIYCGWRTVLIWMLNYELRMSNKEPITYSVLNRSPGTYSVLNRSPGTYSVLNRSPGTYSVLNRSPGTYSILNMSPGTYSILNRSPVTYSVLNKEPKVSNLLHIASLKLVSRPTAKVSQSTEILLAIFQPSVGLCIVLLSRISNAYTVYNFLVSLFFQVVLMPGRFFV